MTRKQQSFGRDLFEDLLGLPLFRILFLPVLMLLLFVERDREGGLFRAYKITIASTEMAVLLKQQGLWLKQSFLSHLLYALARDESFELLPQSPCGAVQILSIDIAARRCVLTDTVHCCHAVFTADAVRHLGSDFRSHQTP